MHTSTTTRTFAIAAALTLGLTLASCSTSNSGSEAGSSSSTSVASAHNDQDVMFAQMMLPHHKQAVEMSDMLLAKGSGVDTDVTDLAKQIKAEQSPEINQLTTWLKGWGESTESEHSGMGHSMSGMMSDSDMDDLDQASGDDAAKLYLEQMVQHHEGAVDMAKTEVDKGKNTDAVAMAKSIVSSQTEQITQMQDMLASL
ncbi:hypothetical protein NS263_07825 [Curtobacterium oceanosedimentum]|uniref:DUF305 domain-containing protein n=1 Tax=Curtobacterium oceanosedimentum TaxID=465820 RepID=A0A147DSV2_9MICO|nr:DUF305 domain-containing protein [Curtobacterium oceanosedimentum]KTR40365.1 hypothetical protein NS263_07825 [Curtobacterium oceanosedimentum]KTR53221.1 hypothetical protein NS359_03955 [Curtobacterium oceanosedimentum]